jgi:hypothetical protein
MAADDAFAGVVVEALFRQRLADLSICVSHFNLSFFSNFVPVRQAERGARQTRIRRGRQRGARGKAKTDHGSAGVRN